MKGFFSCEPVATNKWPTRLVPRCGACGLYRHCTSPKMPLSGEGRKGILVVAEAPGELEDERGVQLVGKAGQLFRNRLDECNIDLDKDCWKTNALICRPANNRTPTDMEIDHCRPNLLREIREKQPRIILLLGGIAVKSLIGILYRDQVGPIGKWVGWQIPSQQINAWVCPLWHPSYLLRTNDDVLELWFRRYLKEAVSLKERPWSEVPDYRSQIKRIIDPDEAADILLDEMQRDWDFVGFDYETDRLKPDAADARIVSCSVSFGTKEGPQRTIAYPWSGRAVEATGRLLRSPVAKIASNLKFEDRWTRKEFGHRVRNWSWDTMLASHVMDHRPGITGVKFQSFVRLGFGDYSSSVEEFLKAKQSNSPNRIDEIELPQLLLYNGLDSFLEVQVAIKQMRELGVL